ncbi:MAG: FeoA family protein [Clostridia bacterium]|nr:FeoA family protein [Clostridia bacterium]MDD4048949.1 FeoA family protein [Clostridia bacterium]
MKEKFIPLHLMPIGSTGKVRNLLAKDDARRRMLDLGLISDTFVEALRKSPSGDPIAYQIRGAVIALRSEEASNIMVEMV